MDENNVHTSVVIELANQEEPEDQKTYQIDIDDVDLPKDYVIDQIFCGENITVYALFEVPESTNKNSNKHLMEVSNSSRCDDYRFIHRNSFKKLVNEKKYNGCRQNLSVMHSEENVEFISSRDQGNGSLYCLKHLGGNYEMLTPESKSSDLKVLYSKEVVSKTSKSTKFKAVSKGVNTDIVQSPRIIEEVQKAVGLNLPIVKTKGITTEAGKPSYEIIEMEMRHSFSSLSSESGSKKSVPSFFLVPLLMMEDGVLSHFQREDKKQKLMQEKLLDSKTLISPKVSLGINTDPDEFIEKKNEETSDSQLENFKTDSENSETQKISEKKENSNSQLKPNSKETILKEIKKMQGKLNVLIKSIESNDFDSDLKEDEVTESDCKTYDETVENFERTSEFLLMDPKPFERNQKKFDDRPIYPPLTYLPHSKKTKVKSKKKAQSTGQEVKNDASDTPEKKASVSLVSGELSSTSEIIKNDEKPRVKLKRAESYRNIAWKELENRKGAGLSKSETNIRVSLLDTKYCLINGLKKSLSTDLKDDKVEVLKKIKNFSFKVEGSVKVKTNMRILQNKEVHLGGNIPLLKCEMGDDVNQKPKSSKTDLLNSAQATEKVETISLKEIAPEAKKNLKEEEGDAKLVYPKDSYLTQAYVENVEKLQVHYCNTNTTASDGLLKIGKSLSPCGIKSKTVEKNTEAGTKVCSDSEKPITPNKSCRKIYTTDSNAKKDVKTTKKSTYRFKVGEKAIKSEEKNVFQQEVDKKKSVSNSRKSTRNNAESKLHVDKLIKSDISNTQKTTQLTKLNNDEKPATKSDRLPRLISQKRELAEHSSAVLCEEKETKCKISKEKSVVLVEVDSCYRKSVLASNVKENPEPEVVFESKRGSPAEASPNLASENLFPLSSNPSSVVVELFSKKPTSVEKFYSEVDQECANSGKTSVRENEFFGKSENEKNTNESSVNLEKPIVKSVWALTKVLLYEDGTKKLEVLEASLTPPGYCLNQPLKSQEDKFLN